ncbi:DSBA oxidoreductase domain protein [Mycobacteroides abscessus 5S-0921]|nr:DSBA oxidoreductase domain protein [Mycobacteroides abscessus 5S-0921]
MQNTFLEGFEQCRQMFEIMQMCGSIRCVPGAGSPRDGCFKRVKSAVLMCGST